jgi:hypothetical protein
MSARRVVISLLLAAPLVACAPPAADQPPDPVLLRIVCGIQRWLEQHEFRVREEDVGRCSGAARQIETTRERMREALEKTVEREPERPAKGDPNRTEQVAP